MRHVVLDGGTSVLIAIMGQVSYSYYILQTNLEEVKPFKVWYQIQQQEGRP